MSIKNRILLAIGSLTFLFGAEAGTLFAFQDYSVAPVALAIGIAVAASGASAWLLIRSIVPPMRKALTFSSNIAVGYLENVITADGTTEFDELLRYLADIQQSRVEIRDHLERQISETETAYFDIQTTSAALRQANTSMNIMLNALNQGLFTFGADGLCSTTFSKACLQLLEGSPAGKHLRDILRAPPDDTSISRVIEFIFSPTDSAIATEDMLALLPGKFSKSDGTGISLAYYPIKDEEGKLHSVLAVATDNSAAEAALQQMHEHEAQALRILRIIGNRNLFAAFYNSLSGFCSRVDAGVPHDGNLDILRRDLHTLKGNASIFHLHEVVDALHHIEEQLANVTVLSDACAIVKADLPRLQAIVTNVHKQAYDLLGRDFDQHGVTRTLSLDALKTLALRVKIKTFDSTLYHDFVEQLMGEPIRKALMPFDLGLRDLADRYGKKVSPCYFTGDNFPLLTEKYQPLFASFSHISRNIISHAIDSPEERAERQKDPELMVLIETKKYQGGQNKGWFRITFQDDGCGIDVPHLREKLAITIPEDRIAQMDDKAIMNCIFNDNISTTDQANELSGRGVGLSAVRYEAEKLGGKVFVESELGAYTRIVVDAPIDWTLPEERACAH